jgi:hypothetical protein
MHGLYKLGVTKKGKEERKYLSFNLMRGTLYLFILPTSGAHNNSFLFSLNPSLSPNKSNPFPSPLFDKTEFPSLPFSLLRQPRTSFNLAMIEVNQPIQPPILALLFLTDPITQSISIKTFNLER